MPHPDPGQQRQPQVSQDQPAHRLAKSIESGHVIVERAKRRVVLAGGQEQPGQGQRRPEGDARLTP